MHTKLRKSLLICASGLLLALGLSAEVTISPSAEEPNLSGRIQHTAPPGSGAGAMSHMGQKLPQETIRVGPSAKAGIGLAFLIGIEVNDNERNELMMASKIELLVDVVGVDTYNGAPPSPLTVALLTSSEMNHPEWGHYGAWNNANNFKEIGTIESDPSAGVYRFDVTEALRNAPSTTKDKPMIFFAIYSPVADLTEANGSKHVFIGGTSDTAPRILITE